MSGAVPRYAPAILDALAGHGLAPRADTAPRALRDAINDLYRYEIRRLRAAHPDTPVYAVVEEVCASGGYYVAVAMALNVSRVPLPDGVEPPLAPLPRGA